jgi:hypothetical protein
MPQSVRLALATLAVMQQIRSLLREKRTFLPALKMTLLIRCVHQASCHFATQHALGQIFSSFLLSAQ